MLDSISSARTQSNRSWSVIAIGCSDAAVLDTLESLSASELDLTDFDACIDCLDTEATEGTSRDCALEPSDESCRALLSTALDLTCL